MSAVEWIYGCTCAAFLLDGWLNLMCFPVFTAVSGAFSFSPITLSWIVAAKPMGDVLFSMPASRLAHHWDPRYAQVLGAVGLACTCALFALVRPAWAFILLRLVQGGASSLLVTSSMTTMTLVFYDESTRAQRISFLSTFFGVGCMIGLVGGGWTYILLGRRLTFLTTAVPFAVLALVLVYSLLDGVGNQRQQLRDQSSLRLTPRARRPHQTPASASAAGRTMAKENADMSDTDTSSLDGQRSREASVDIASDSHPLLSGHAAASESDILEDIDPTFWENPPRFLPDAFVAVLLLALTVSNAITGWEVMVLRHGTVDMKVSVGVISTVLGVSSFCYPLIAWVLVKCELSHAARLDVVASAPALYLVGSLVPTLVPNNLVAIGVAGLLEISGQAMTDSNVNSLLSVHAEDMLGASPSLSEQERKRRLSANSSVLFGLSNTFRSLGYIVGPLSALATYQSAGFRVASRVLAGAYAFVWLVIATYFRLVYEPSHVRQANLQV